MKRRKALLKISLLAGGSLLVLGGYKLLRVFKSPPAMGDLMSHKQLIIAVADIIIPRSDSPAASECGVHEFVSKMVMDADVQTQNNFMTGLKTLEEYSKSQYRKTFLDCTVEEKNSVVAYLYNKEKLLSGKLGRIEQKLLGWPFIYTLREFVVIGYFTSQPGATIALRYDHIPKTYQGCLPYMPGEKSWATY